MIIKYRRRLYLLLTLNFIELVLQLIQLSFSYKPFKDWDWLVPVVWLLLWCRMFLSDYLLWNFTTFLWFLFDLFMVSAKMQIKDGESAAAWLERKQRTRRNLSIVVIIILILGMVTCTAYDVHLLKSKDCIAGPCHNDDDGDVDGKDSKDEDGDG